PMPSPPMYNQPQIEQKPSLEELMSKFISTSEARFQNQDASIKNLETQVGQLAKMMSERAQGTLPRNTELNPRGQLNALFSGSTEEASNEQTKPELSTLEQKPLIVQEDLVEHKLETLDPKPKVENKEREKIEQLIDTLKQIKVNVPLIDTLLHMPNHIKNLEEILRNKRKLDESEVVTLSEESSAILQHKLPPKLEDPGGFTIPCTIGSLTVDDALADLGPSINVMPYKKFKKLGIGELRPTKMSIHLVDRTIRHPRGIIENILVMVDKFLFPIDFVVLDMDESFKTPLILGRPFLATARALIDVEQRELILRVREEKVVLKMNNDALKLIFSSDNEGIISEQPGVSLVEETTLGVRKMLTQDTVNKVKVILEDNPTIPPDIQQTKTQIEESEGQSRTLEKIKTTVSKIIKKNKPKTKTPHDPFLHKKWVPTIKEPKPSPTLQQNQRTPKLMNRKKKEILDPG